MSEVNEVELEKVEVIACGHINKHYLNPDQELQDLACELPAGHAGDHEAACVALRPVDGSIAQAKQIAAGKQALSLSGKMEKGIGWIDKKYVETPDRAYWSDAAGIPASEIKPDLEQLARIKAAKGNFLDEAQVLRNPNI